MVLVAFDFFLVLFIFIFLCLIMLKIDKWIEKKSFIFFCWNKFLEENRRTWIETRFFIIFENNSWLSVY